MGYNTVTIGTAAALIIAANTQRQSLVLVNSGPATCFIGQDTSITTGNSIFLEAEDTFTEDSGGGSRVYQGDVYGITSIGNTTVIRYWERTR
jgi:hypothetical protein